MATAYSYFLQELVKIPQPPVFAVNCLKNWTNGASRFKQNCLVLILVNTNMKLGSAA